MKMYLDEKRSEVEKMQRSLVASALDPKLLTLKRIESGQNIAGKKSLVCSSNSRALQTKKEQPASLLLNK